MKVLILGGYGAFGGRLALLLADTDLHLLIAGRDLTRAQAFCAAFQGHADPVLADRASIAQTLKTHRPDILIDASGPFQDYGPTPYSVLQACIDTHTNHLDFADGAEFVAGVSQFDAQAKAAGIFALSGVSSFPVLTAAVLREMALSMDIAEVTGGIAPSPHAGVGLNVLRAVLGYAGAPVPLVREGKPATGRGLAETRRHTVAPPGALPLASLLFSLVDVPDLRAIPTALPQIQSLWMGAGLVPEPLHRLLITLARLRATLGLPALAPLAPLAYLVLNALKYGDHRGGMFIEATGTRNGEPVTRSWHMLAEGDDGPFIPSALIRRAAAGQPPAPGARSGIDALSLADYDTLFAGPAIITGWRDDPTGPIYEQTLGPAFATLPAALQSLHRPGARSLWSGRATVQRGNSPVAALVALLFSFPAAGADIPVSVTFLTQPDGTETWGRNFDGRLMVSTQEAGRGRNQHLITERFGPFAFGLALVTDGPRLRIIPRRWTLFGLPLPRALMPRGDSYETERNGKFRFHVEIALPVVGPVVTYDGWLDPVP
jgi:Domain of unknown function (DUF4166)/Saccharopine dehydrogenase NADP binding domain